MRSIEFVNVDEVEGTGGLQFVGRVKAGCDPW
jgi:hypothetical protein